MHPYKCRPPLIADSDVPGEVEKLRRQNISFQKALRKVVKNQASLVDHMVYESVNGVNEGVGTAIRSSVLAGLLAIPGILSADTISKGINSTERNSKAPISMQSDRVRDVLNGRTDNSKMCGSHTEAQAINIVARTIFAEGNGETSDGRLGIATTIYNRAHGNPSEMVGVVSKRKAYSCWNGVGANYFNPSTYTNSLPSLLKKNIGNKSLEKAWDDSKAIATKLIEGTFEPKWNGADYTHYVTLALYNSPKSAGRWFYRKPGKILGRHIFFTSDAANSKPIKR